VEASVDKITARFSYFVGNDAVFYDAHTFEEVHVSKKVLGDKLKYLKDGTQSIIIDRA
jgi:translation elongation factor P/translation initiation factor 5A